MASKKTSPARTIKKSSNKKAPAKSKAALKTASKASAKSSAAAKPAKAARRAAAKPKAPKRANAIVHWEIQSTQPELLHEFYSDVFGWNIDTNNPMKYGLVSSKGANGGIDGGIGGSEDSKARVLVYASVASIAPILKRIEDRGGKTLMPRTDIGPVVMAIYLDPEGNTMGLIEDR